MSSAFIVKADEPLTKEIYGPDEFMDALGEFIRQIENGAESVVLEWSA